ncbi:hypothetical protein CAEBREN_18381 [Caenorhabditis brenneri]|uniref:SET domain-containing protein n=1 Tax=Caenorhabditis brenneri TaxID=135651 RepID=G0MR35_CAEBE|nr:hypothetical protein CAEBREN_18381 [Caenorhabditis brenneri]
MESSKNVAAEAQAKPRIGRPPKKRNEGDATEPPVKIQKKEAETPAVQHGARDGSVDLSPDVCIGECNCPPGWHERGKNKEGPSTSNNQEIGAPSDQKSTNQPINSTPDHPTKPIIQTSPLVKAPEPTIFEHATHDSHPIQVPQKIMDKPAAPRVPEPISQVPHNTYSDAASALLSTMNVTHDSHLLLGRSSKELMPKARKRTTRKGEKRLALLENSVRAHDPIREVNGYISIASETDRQPGGSEGTFLYDGLKKYGGASVVLDAKGNDSQFMRRSCEPNAILKHLIGSNGRLAILVLARKNLARRVEVTVPFDSDWKESAIPLKCAKHEENIDECPMEKERKEAMEGGN